MVERAARRLVGIGASAGGIDALERLFQHVPRETGMAFVVVQHLSAQQNSRMVELLESQTSMPVAFIEDGDLPLPNRVLVKPPARDVILEDGRLRLVERSDGTFLHLPVDRFFASLAGECGPDAVGVVLSGTGSDGTRGARAIKEAGGRIIVQQPATAWFNGMPMSVVTTGIPDLVCPPEAIGENLTRLAAGQEPVGSADIRDHPAAPEAIEDIARMMLAESGVDFPNYKRSTLTRRIQRRMAMNRVEAVPDYAEVLRTSPDERPALVADLLVSVTGFFRDEGVFERVRDLVVAPLVEGAGDEDTLRIWVPGCASGEEVYSLAMLVREEMDRQDRTFEVRIFGTDIDAPALERAGRGVYPRPPESILSADRVERFMRVDGDNVVIGPELRRMVLFINHDVTRDPPFTKLDLVSCRNVLIYLGPAQQERVLSAFHFALKPGRFLLLGNSESVGGLVNHFDRLEPGLRAYSAVGQHPGIPAFMSGYAGTRVDYTGRPRATQRDGSGVVSGATDALLGQYAPPALLIDEHLRILHVFGDAGKFLRVTSGSPAADVLHLTSGAMSAVLATGVPRVLRSGVEALYRSVKSAGADGDLTMSLRIMPLDAERGEPGQVLVAFEEESPPGAVEHGTVVDEDVEQYIGALQGELQRSRESQRLLVEELGASNEELQATNEELLASNEELQATNEELHSVNDELHSVNVEHERKIEELEALAVDLDNLLRATRIGTVFLGRDLSIRRFTPSVARVLPLREGDIGRPISQIANELGGDAFIDELRSVLGNGEMIERQVTVEQGPILLRMLPYRDRRDEVSGVVLTFVDLKTVLELQAIAQEVLDALPAMVIVIDATGHIHLANRAWHEVITEAAAGMDIDHISDDYFELLKLHPYGQAIRDAIDSVARGEVVTAQVEYEPMTGAAGRWFTLQCRMTPDGRILVQTFDVSVLKGAEQRLATLATTDPLTGVLNRRGLEEPIERITDQIARSGVSAGVIMLDIDNFKSVNDDHGHAVGDVTLTQVAATIHEHVRPTDVVSRVGGDEFVVLLPETNQVEVGLIAERVRLAVASINVRSGDATLQVTASMAVASLDAGISGLEDILVGCRDALSSSKRRGKNRVTYTHPEHGGRGIADRIQQVVMRLVRGEQALSVVGQPIVSTNGGAVAVELLSRYAGPPEVSTDTLFRAALEEGALPALDERCLWNCIAAASELPDSLRIHINVFPATLLGLPRPRLNELLDAISARSVCLELSEQYILGNPAYLLPIVRELREAGGVIAIDDVGFGRTSLETLIVLEPEFIKIDRSYVAGIGAEPHRVTWLKRLVQTARSLGTIVIAEGVEAEEDAASLFALGIELAQGNHFAVSTELRELGLDGVVSAPEL
ncbi:MAG: diguanylate cyclase [Actinobacteria bacterium]|nr:diguanylate cyclase [Thermoleophilia bacterium]MCB9012323.1 diguanylate cyclase [Actinomycetota bacterium]